MTDSGYRRFTHGPAAQYVWVVSPWDHHAHACLARGEVTTTAICGHAARTSKLIADDGSAAECTGCVVAISRLVIGPANNRFDWRPPQHGN